TAERGWDAAQFRQRLGGLRELTLQKIDLLEALFPRHLERLRRHAAVFGGDHLRDLVDREAELPAFENEREMMLVLPRVDARPAVARRGQQPLALIQAQRARGHAEFLRHLPDPEGLLLPLPLRPG